MVLFVCTAAAALAVVAWLDGYSEGIDSDGANYDAIHDALTDWDKAVREINGIDGKAHGGSVMHPDHYQSDGIECIDAMYEVSPELAIDFSVGPALKYLDRAGLKGDMGEDLRKAAWYCERAAKEASR